MRVCSIEGCNRKHEAKGLCSFHYLQQYKGRKITLNPTKQRMKGDEICLFEGCEKKAKSFGYCNTHYFQLYRNTELKPIRKGKQKCKIEGCDEFCYAHGFCLKHYNLTEERVESLKRIRKKYKQSEKGKAVYAKKDRQRRARKKNAPVVEDFTIKEIYERDGYICWVCNLPIDPNLRRGDPLAITLEHIVPLCKGGEHSRNNCSCSHAICNSRKGVKLLEPSFDGASI